MESESNPEMIEVVPGVSLVGNAWQRVLYEDDPKEKDFEAAHFEVQAIRSELSDLRHRLNKLGDIEALFDFDSTAKDVARSLTLAIHVLHSLQTGERSFMKRAERSRELWADVKENPEKYSIQPGTSKEAQILSMARNRVERADNP